MRLNEGAIGRQESVSMISLALYVSVVFTMDSEQAYTDGNSSYVWAPLAVAGAFAVFLAAAAAMRRSGCKDIVELMRSAFGGAVGGVMIYALAALMIYAAYLPLMRFVNAIHNIIFVEAQFGSVVAWMIPVVALQAFLGLECVGRAAKCFAYTLGILLLISLVSSAGSYEGFRLYPLFGDGFIGAAQKGGQTVFRTLPAFIAALGVMRGMQGEKNVRKYGIISMCISAGMICVTQLALALTYTYGELSEMYLPLYRLNMIKMGEGYFFRLDKLAMFIWLIGCLLSAGFYVYAASLIICRQGAARDVRPVALSAAGMPFFLVLLANSSVHSAMDSLDDFLTRFGSVIVAAPVLLASLICAVKAGKEERNEAA